jgi:hypothetical protein
MQDLVFNGKNRYLLGRFFDQFYFSGNNPWLAAMTDAPAFPVTVHGTKKHAHFLWISL